MSTTFFHETDDEIMFHFVCEGCESEGELALKKKDGMQPFGCPEDCGAQYVPWKFQGIWHLRCVVLPVFEEGK